MKNYQKLSKSYNITIDQNDFDYVFYDDFNEHGYQVTGIALYEFDEVYKNEPEFDNVYASIPNEIKNLHSDDEFDYTALIKQSNILSEIKNNLLLPRDIHNDGFIEMIETIENHAPEQLEPSMFNEKKKVIKFNDFNDDFANFIEKLLLDESQLTINGQKFHIQTPNDMKRNYAKLYFESKQYEDFLKLNK